MNIDDFFAVLGEPSRRNSIALHSSVERLAYRQLVERVKIQAERLRNQEMRVVASLMDNGADWIINDLACLRAGAAHIPLPLFFTPEQWRDTLNAAGIDGIVAADTVRALLSSCGFAPVDRLSPTLALYRRPAHTHLPPGTVKITFTSGSTDRPKGVCIGAPEMFAVAEGLAHATRPLGLQSHLTALPLPVLLENIAGVYAPLICAAAIHVRPLHEVGLQGSSRFEPSLFHAALTDAAAQSVIVLPQMLRAYCAWLRSSGARAPRDIRLMAVGGAAVGVDVLAEARKLGLPAYEGYGLSEACSVQTLNLPGADCPGSAGRPLPHARLRVTADGEIEVAGSHAHGYLGQPSARRQWLPTGDLGYLDDKGYLHIQGRRKNMLITGFGRNVSPEWIELRLASLETISQAVVLGDGEPVLGAVIWPRGDASDEAISACLDRVNKGLPDYARIGPWVRARAEFSAASGLATPNGRPRRRAVADLHADLFSTVAPQHLP